MRLREITAKRHTHLNEADAPPTININGGSRVKAGFAMFEKSIRALGLASLLSPVYDYFEQMNQADDALKSGTATKQQYNEYRVAKAGEMMAKLGVGIVAAVGSFLTDIIFIRFIGIIPIIGPLVVSVYKLLSQGARIYLMQQLRTKEGTEALAALISVSILKDMGRYGTIAIDWLHDTILEAINQDKTKTPDQQKQPAAQTATPAAAPTPVDPTKPNSQNDYMTPRIADPEFDFTPQGLHRDKNGFLIY
jgi:hypothetical protein